ncbi:hypothetical protein Tco_0199259 [Tanacetum coccineum]
MNDFTTPTSILRENSRYQSRGEESRRVDEKAQMRKMKINMMVNETTRMMKMMMYRTMMRMSRWMMMKNRRNQKMTKTNDNEELKGIRNVEGAKSDMKIANMKRIKEMRRSKIPLIPILKLKALEDNFSELRQTNQYAEALSSIPGTVDQYLANKMQEAKIIKEQVKKEVSKITPKIEKLVTDQLESEVLVRSSKEANTSHAVAANLSELELKKILIDKMEANNSINRSDIQRQLYRISDAYKPDKNLLELWRYGPN